MSVGRSLQPKALSMLASFGLGVWLSLDAVADAGHSGDDRGFAETFAQCRDGDAGGVGSGRIGPGRPLLRSNEPQQTSQFLSLRIRRTVTRCWGVAGTKPRTGVEAASRARGGLASYPGSLFSLITCPPASTDLQPMKRWVRLLSRRRHRRQREFCSRLVGGQAAFLRPTA